MPGQHDPLSRGPTPVLGHDRVAIAVQHQMRQTGRSPQRWRRPETASCTADGLDIHKAGGQLGSRGGKIKRHGASVTWHAMFHVDSEVGLLRQVILHRPGLELKRLTPDNAAELLFDDLLWVSEAQAEHDAFAAALRARDVRVHYYGELLAQTMDIGAARDYVLGKVFDPRLDRPLAIDTLRETLGALTRWPWPRS